MAVAALGSVALLPVLGVAAAQAADGNTMATLRPVALNGVKGSGTAMVEVHGNRIDVTMAASGLLPDSPHAAHIHFGADARHECPVAADDKDRNGTLVVHGVDHNGDGKYDGEAKSDLDPSLPTEATDPALCGALRAMPAGAIQTGTGGAAAGGVDEELLLAGGTLVLPSIGSGGYLVRRARSQA